MNYALLAFTITTFSTTLGALPVFLIKRASPKQKNGIMGFSAGIMLAATCFSLLLPALDIVLEESRSIVPAVMIGVATLLGGVFLKVLNSTIPHQHFDKG